MHRGIFDSKRSKTCHDFRPLGISARASFSEPELLTVRALDSVTAVGANSNVNRERKILGDDHPTECHCDGETASLNLEIRDRDIETDTSSLKDRRAPCLLPTSSFFRSYLTPRFHRLRRRRRPASAQWKHSSYPQQQQQQQQSFPSDPNCFDISPTDVEPGENVTDSRERLQDGTAPDDDDVVDDEDFKGGNEDSVGGHLGDSSDLKAALKELSHSASKKNVIGPNQPESRERRTPLLSIVKSFAKSLTPSSSSLKSRSDAEIIALARIDDDKSLVKAVDQKSQRHLSFDRVLWNRFRRQDDQRRGDDERQETSDSNPAETGKEAPFDAIESEEEEEQEGNGVDDNDADICETEDDQVENQDDTNDRDDTNDLCQPSAFSLGKFSRNGGDTVTSSIYEHTVASVDSAYNSLTVGRAAEVAASGEAAAVRISKGKRRFGVSCITDEVDGQLDGFGLKRGFFDGSEKRSVVDDADGRRDSATPLVFKALVWRKNEESVAQVCVDEKRLPFVAIDMEEALPGSVRSSASRKKSDVILPLSLDGGTKITAVSPSRPVIASRVPPSVKERFSVNRVPETTLTGRSSPLPGKALEFRSLPTNVNASNLRLISDKDHSLSTVCDSMEESGTFSQRSYVEEEIRGKERRPPPEVSVANKRSQVEPLVGKASKPRPKWGLPSSFRLDSGVASTTSSVLACSSPLDRAFLLLRDEARSKTGFKCSEQQLINGSMNDDECFFYREKVPLTSVIEGDSPPESARERKRCHESARERKKTNELALEESEPKVKTEAQDGHGNPQSGPYKRLLSSKDSRDPSVARLAERQMERTTSRDSQSHLIEPSVIADPNIGLDNNAYHTTVSIGEVGPICEDLFHAKKVLNGPHSPTEIVPPVFVGAPRLDTQHRKRVRLVDKHGTTNITHSKIPRRWSRYWSDIFTTMLEMKWRYVFVIFASQFFLSWVFFAAIWYLICWAHGDFKAENKVDGFTPCVTNMNDFTSAILFSIETQHTIGYGSRYTTEECAGAVFIMMIQSIVGIFGQACIVGLVFTKLARPKKRAETLLLSKRAVICLRDRKYRLLFRVGDVRPDFMTDCKVQTILIQRKTTKEGESLPLHQTPIRLETCELFLTWPIVIGHEIDSDSPFYCMDEHDMNIQDFELVIVVEGNVEATAMRTQIRTSFLPDEILWGYHFKPCVRFSDGRYIVDYSKFHETVKCHMPKVSAQKWEEMEETLYLMHRQQRESGSETDSPVRNREQNNNIKNIKEVEEAETENTAGRETSLAATTAPRELAIAQHLTSRNPISMDLQYNGNHISRTGTPPIFSSATSVSSGVHMNGVSSARASPNRSHSQSSNYFGADFGGPRGGFHRPSTPVQVINYYSD